MLLAVVVVAAMLALHKRRCYLQHIAISTASSSWLAYPATKVIVHPTVVGHQDDDDGGVVGFV